MTQTYRECEAQGRAAALAGKTLAACPHSAEGGTRAARRADAWRRGFFEVRTIEQKPVTLILLGSHGGELDRITINVTPCEDGDIFLSQILSAYTPDWIMSAGDRIVFEIGEPERASTYGHDSDGTRVATIDTLIADSIENVRQSGERAAREGVPVDRGPIYTGPMRAAYAVAWREGWESVNPRTTEVKS